MGVIDKTMDTAGGVIGGGVKGVLIGALVTIAAPAVILGGIGLLGGLGAAAVMATIGAVLGAAAAASGASLGGAIGALGGGAKKLFGNDGKDKGQDIDQQLAEQRQRLEANKAAMLAQRQAAAASFDNPDAATGFAARNQAQQTQAQQTRPQAQPNATEQAAPAAADTPDVTAAAQTNGSAGPGFAARAQASVSNNAAAARA